MLPLRMPLTALAVLGALALPLLPATAAQASPASPSAPLSYAALSATGDADWTVRTASNEFGSDRTSYSYALDPGGSLSDALVIANHGTEPLELGVYAADGFTNSGGQFDVKVGGAKSVGIGAWMTADPARVTVQPGQTLDVPFTLTVPTTATPGDYAGGILTSLVQPDATQQINVDRRLGIRVALRVGGALAPALVVEKPQVTWSGGLNPLAIGDASFGYTIRNTGNTAISSQQSARLTGPFGMLPHDATVADSPRLLPGESWKVSVPVRGIPGLLWVMASATVTPVVVDASGSTTPMTPITAGAAAPAVPWMTLLLLVVLAGLIVLAVRLLRRRARSRTAREEARVAEAVEAALAGAGVEADAAASSAAKTEEPVRG